MKIEFLFLLFNLKFCKRLQILKQNAYGYQERNYQVTQQRIIFEKDIRWLMAL